VVYPNFILSRYERHDLVGVKERLPVMKGIHCSVNQPKTTQPPRKYTLAWLSREAETKE